MNNEIYRFKIGNFDCTIVSDGAFAYPNPGHVFFANAPADRLAHTLQQYDIDLTTWTEYVSPYPSLVINTGSNLVLVDTGADSLGPLTGRLLANLHQAGIAPDRIDTVILTHGHADHIGGTVDVDGKSTFPNARYVMWKDEWTFWMGAPDLSSLQVPDELKQVLIGFAQRYLSPIEAQLELIDSESEIVSGIRAIAAPGHTPGHMALAIESAGERLIDLVDTVLHPIHIEQPDWIAAVDLLPEETMITRRRLLGRSAVEQALVFLYHFPFPGLGHIILDGAGWRWQPR